MSIRIHRFIRAAVACCIAFLVATADGADPPAVVKEELARQGLPIESLSYRIAPLAGPNGNAPPLALAGQRVRNPASAMKLVTTLAALDALGPAHRWNTAMLAEARLDAGVLKGDLYLRGGGEPNLSWERLGAMLRALRNSGVAGIAGDLVLDRSLFQPARPDIGAPPFDDMPDASYNVIPDALTVSDYLLTYTLSSDASRVAVQATPPLSGVAVVNALRLDQRPCAQWDERWRAPTVQQDSTGAVRIVLDSAFPRNCQATVQLATLDRDLYVERLVRALWQEMGGQWSGRVREGTTPVGARVLVERQYETLAETVRSINKHSDAVKARMLFLALGATAAAGQGQPTRERARRRVLDWIAAQGVGTAGIVIDNGSGLSRDERISPEQLGALLKGAATCRWYPEFAASLPIVGVDGTMKRRMPGSRAVGNARLKTGTLRDVAALAGYVRDPGAQEWIVTAFVNDPQADKGRAVLDALVGWVAEGGAAPAPAPHAREAR